MKKLTQSKSFLFTYLQTVTCGVSISFFSLQIWPFAMQVFFNVFYRVPSHLRVAKYKIEFTQSKSFTFNTFSQFAVCLWCWPLENCFLCLFTVSTHLNVQVLNIMSFLSRIYGIKFQNILSLWLLPSLLGHTTKNCLLIRNQIRCFMIHQRSTIKGSKVKSAARRWYTRKLLANIDLAQNPVRWYTQKNIAKHWPCQRE